MKKTTKKRTKSKKTTSKQAKAAGKVAAKKPKSKKPGGGQKPKRVSALDAAAQVLAKAGKPMRAQELIAAMAEPGLWKSPAGKTPHATLYAAMMREARDKGTASRQGYGVALPQGRSRDVCVQRGGSLIDDRHA